MILKKYLSSLGLFFIVSSSLSAAPLNTTISIKNTHASYVNGGMCSIAFDLVAYEFLDNVQKINLSVTLKDKKGKEIDKEVVTVDEFNMVGGKTYSGFFIEGENACNAFGETLIISKALVYYNDGTKIEDIVKTKKLVIDDFKPMKIIIGAGK